MAAVLAVGLAGSAAATVAVRQAQHRHVAQLMDQYADELSRAVVGEADRYRDTLSDVAASVGAQSDFTAADFTEITYRLSRQRLPGASGISFVVAAGDDQVAGVEKTWRAQGASGLILDPAGSGREHLFMIFNRPLDASSVVTGRDLSQLAEPVDALRTSRGTGLVTASHTYILLKDRALPAAEQQMSFLLAAPVYGGLGTPAVGRFRGWIVMGMRGSDFITDVLRSHSRGAVAVTLTDLSTATPTVVAQPPAGAVAPDGTLDRERTIEVGQRRWQLRVEPTGKLLASANRRMPEITLGIALLITLLVATLAGILAGARNRAMDQVDRATTALRDDISRRERVELRLREREGELRHLALHDPLTGLANRTLFQERVEHAIATHSRGTTTPAVLFIDLDGFKQINDNHGHGAGDSVLAEVAVRLRECVRTGDTVGRFGGDEFAVLAERVVTVDEATIVAERIVQALREPFEVDGERHHITASAGLAMHREGTGADEMIRSADRAMYAAKSAGKNHYALA